MTVIRPALPEDVAFLAKVVAVAASLVTMEELQENVSDERLKVMEELCASDWSLYSWQRAITAVDQESGRSVGCIISYDGAIYEKARALTFSYAEKRLGKNFGTTDIETHPGEYYLDSMAILPEFRGDKLGQRLMNAAMEVAARQGHKKVTLIADKHAPRLRAYYSQLGFKEVEEISFFDHPYIRMVKEII